MENSLQLLVYGAGQVIPNSLKILQPNLQYSVLVGLSSTAQYGLVILVMSKNFCADNAGNRFERNKNSNFSLLFGESSFYFHRIFFPNRQYVSLFLGRVISDMSFHSYSCLCNWPYLIWFFDWLLLLLSMCSLILQIDEVST